MISVLGNESTSFIFLAHFLHTGSTIAAISTRPWCAAKNNRANRALEEEQQHFTFI
jgi:hypothetical protein